MTAKNDWINLQSTDVSLSYNEVEFILNVTRKVMQSAKQIQSIWQRLNNNVTAGDLDNVPTDLKTALTAYYTSLSTFKDAVVGNTEFMELYETLYPPHTPPGF